MREANAMNTADYPESELQKYQAAPRLSMLDWRRVMTALYRTGQKDVADRLLEAMAEDEASEGVPTKVFGLLMFVPDDRQGNR